MAEQKARNRRLGNQPKPVIQRWWRLKSVRVAKRVARFMSRWKLPLAERKRRRVLASTFETIKSLAIKHENGKFTGLSILFNIGLYLLIADRDIQAVKLGALTHPDEWTRKLHARIMLLTIYEWDADKVAGRQLKQAMELMLVPDELQREAIECLRDLRLVQRKARKQFAFIRNVAIAHRDPNALIQYRAIRDLDVNAVFALATEFFGVVEKFVGIQTKLLAATDNLPSLLNQWAANTKA
ncbi:MAG: hypothetical protein Q7T45_14385 [Bradyrhizobium sp.]|uniref:hypothetical protein n=1 Tax=Bradyrhizobium sp. TaxID=376 RepID=UPI0027270536|nr:hypothetical protein [Bradyrhizobium sp.]MDO8399001.1 hypothetical protein [Bradyrhizobium sp.]